MSWNAQWNVHELVTSLQKRYCSNLCVSCYKYNHVWVFFWEWRDVITAQSVAQSYTIGCARRNLSQKLLLNCGCSGNSPGRLSPPCKKQASLSSLHSYTHCTALECPLRSLPHMFHRSAHSQILSSFSHTVCYCEKTSYISIRLTLI